MATFLFLFLLLCSCCSAQTVSLFLKHNETDSVFLLSLPSDASVLELAEAILENADCKISGITVRSLSISSKSERIALSDKLLSEHGIVHHSLIYYSSLSFPLNVLIHFGEYDGKTASSFNEIDFSIPIGSEDVFGEITHRIYDWFSRENGSVPSEFPMATVFVLRQSASPSSSHSHSLSASPLNLPEPFQHFKMSRHQRVHFMENEAVSNDRALATKLQNASMVRVHPELTAKSVEQEQLAAVPFAVIKDVTSSDQLIQCAAKNGRNSPLSFTFKFQTDFSSFSVQRLRTNSTW